MPRRRGERKPDTWVNGEASASSATSLEELERFSLASLHRWKIAGQRLRDLNVALYFGLERYRTDHAAELIEALRVKAQSAFDFKGWARIVDYQYALAPLSVAGSLTRDGGRFNIGHSLNPASFPPFPALYIAEDYDTAFRERFVSAPNVDIDGLVATENELRRPASFTHVQLRGHVELVFDVGNLDALAPFATVIGQFKLPSAVRALARQIGVRPPTLVRSPSMLQKQVLDKNWRMLPVQYDLPSNSQVFGRLLVAAGFHGVIYPSVKNSERRCLALFPQNWAGTSSFVEISDQLPQGVRQARLDGSCY